MMNQQEIWEKYRIPQKVLEEYLSWGLCEAAENFGGYDEADLGRLCTIMALHDIGFGEDEVRQYMLLVLAGDDTAAEREAMLQDLRKCKLKEIHLRETQLDRLDYLRYEMKHGKRG